MSSVSRHLDLSFRPLWLFIPETREKQNFIVRQPPQTNASSQMLNVPHYDGYRTPSCFISKWKVTTPGYLHERSKSVFPHWKRRRKNPTFKTISILKCIRCRLFLGTLSTFFCRKNK